MAMSTADCADEPLGKVAFLRALALELGRAQLREGNTDSAQIVVSYQCDGSARVRLRMAGDLERERELRLDDVAQRERARTLALAVAELGRGGDASAPKSATGCASPGISGS